MKNWITRQNEKIRKLESIKNNHTIWSKYSVPQKYRVYKRLWDLKHPMNRRLTSIKQRCENPNDTMYYLYGDKGIKCLLTLKDLHYLWKRDNAKNMENPSVDRIDNKGNYTLKNCRFLEGIDNSKRTRRIVVKDSWKERLSVEDIAIIISKNIDIRDALDRDGYKIQGRQLVYNELAQALRAAMEGK